MSNIVNLDEYRKSKLSKQEVIRSALDNWDKLYNLAEENAERMRKERAKENDALVRSWRLKYSRKRSMR